MTTVLKGDRNPRCLAEQDVQREVQREVGPPGGHPVSGRERQLNGETFAPGVGLGAVELAFVVAAAKREREVAQVPRRGTCKCVRGGSAFRTLFGGAARRSWLESVDVTWGGRIVGWGRG